MTGYDIIGDIHGCAAELRTLLADLGYRRDDTGVHRHAERTAVFVGDLIDRGEPEDQREVLQTVKAMVDAGAAHIVMGNHEFNAVCYATPDPNKPGDFLRSNEDPSNRDHHAEFLVLDEDERERYVEWFKTLPLWLELDGPDGTKLRVIHACWHEPSMKVVEKLCGSEHLLTAENFAAASVKDSDLYRAIEMLLKGPEINITSRGCDPYYDFGKKKREDARVRWWDRHARTLRELADVRGMKTKHDKEYPKPPAVPVESFDFSVIYRDEVPVVYGHYWFDWDNRQEDWTEYTACVDFGAIGHKGRLVAYRWNGEPKITWDNYLPRTSDTVARQPSD